MIATSRRPERSGKEARRPRGSGPIPDGRWILLGAFLGVVSLACGSAELSTRLPDEASCIVVSVGTVSGRAAFGPNVARLAREGVVFERAYSSAPRAVSSIGSYLTGLRPHTIALKREQRIAKGVLFISHAFEMAGFPTAGFTMRAEVGMAFDGPRTFQHYVGFARGFEHAQVDGDEQVDQALAWIDAVGRRRFFLYLHLGEDERGGASAKRVGPDALIGRLLDGLRGRDLLDRVAIVLLADGAPRGEGSPLRADRIHVPLVFRLPPGVGAAGARASAAVGLVDLAPTLAELFDLGPALREQSEGVSLWGALQLPAEQMPTRTVFAQSLSGVAAIRDGYELIVGTDDDGLTEELLRLGDVAEPARDPERAAALREEIAGMLGAPGSPDLAVLLEEETERQIGSLGYLIYLEQPEYPGSVRAYERKSVP